MKKKSTLDLTREQYEGECWDTAIAHMKKQVEDRHNRLLESGKKVREAAEEFFNEDEGLL
jgi:hypothetical protein